MYLQTAKVFTNIDLFESNAETHAQRL